MTKVFIVKFTKDNAETDLLHERIEQANCVELTPSELELMKFCIKVVDKHKNQLSREDFIKLDSFGRTQILKKLEGLE